MPPGQPWSADLCFSWRSFGWRRFVAPRPSTLFRRLGKFALDDIRRGLGELLRLPLAAECNLFQDFVTPQFIACDSLVDGLDLGGATLIGSGQYRVRVVTLFRQPGVNTHSR